MLFRWIAVAAVLCLTAYLLWPWIGQLSMSDQISIRAGGVSVEVPIIMGLFGSIGLAAMVLAVKR